MRRSRPRHTYPFRRRSEDSFDFLAIEARERKEKSQFEVSTFPIALGKQLENSQFVVLT